jgi:hypothetical protein
MRTDLGDYNSIVCFKALVVGVEEALGERAAMVALKAAGRKRGANLVSSLGLSGAAPKDAAVVATALDNAIGKSGTKLCAVDKFEIHDGTYRVHLRETVCSAGEPQGSPRQLSFTLGAVHGAVESLYGVKLSATQVGSVLRGQDHDIIELVAR